MKRTLPAVAGFAALVLSPHLACTSDDNKQLDPAVVERLRESVEGTWEYKDGATTIQFRVEQSARDFDPENPHASLFDSVDEVYAVPGDALVGEAYACGNHGLVKPASACIDTFHMPLDVTVVAGPALDMPRGTLTSYGGGTEGEIWFALGATEVRGQFVNTVVTLQNAKTLRRIAPAN